MKLSKETPKDILLKLLDIERDIVTELIESLKKCDKPHELAKVSNSIAYHNTCIVKLIDALKEEPQSEDDLLTLLNKKMPKKYLKELKLVGRKSRKFRKRIVR